MAELHETLNLRCHMGPKHAQLLKFEFDKVDFYAENILLPPQRAKFRLKSGKCFYAGFASNFRFEMPYRSQKGPNC